MVDKEDNAKTCRLFVFGCLCAPLFLIGILLYLIFAVIYLVKDYHVCSERSILWVHVLLVLLINAAQVAIQYSADREEDVQLKSIAALLGLNLIIVIYGASVLFGKGVVCDDMRGTGLWVVAHVMFWIAVITTIFAVVLMSVAIYGYFTTGKAVVQRRRMAGDRRKSRRASMRLQNNSAKGGLSSSSAADDGV